MRQVWAGIDAGKTHHHCVVIDAEGRRLFSRRVLNDEATLAQMITDVVALGEVTAWAIDLNAGGAALAITLLINTSQPLLYIPGRVVNRAAGMYRGEGKTDARDAAIIADQPGCAAICDRCSSPARSPVTCRSSPAGLRMWESTTPVR